MKIIEIFQIFLLFSCCIGSSITDIKSGKIKNKFLLLILIVGVVLNAIQYGILNREYLLVFISNSFFIIGVSILLYLMNIWAGGDSKLLIVISVVYPASCYWNIGGSSFTLWILLIFTFSVGYIYLIIDTLIQIIKGSDVLFTTYIIKGFFVCVKQYLKSIIYIMAFGHIYSIIILPYFTIPIPVYVCLNITILWLLTSQEIFFLKKLLITVLAFDILMTMYTKYLPISVEWKNYVLVLIFVIGRLFIEKYNYKKINLEELKEGMVLSKVSSIWIQKFRNNKFPCISDESMKSKLKSEEVDSIIKCKKMKSGMEEIIIVRKIPFAIFISIGMIIYYLIRRILL